MKGILMAMDEDNAGVEVEEDSGASRGKYWVAGMSAGAAGSLNPKRNLGERVLRAGTHSRYKASPGEQQPLSLSPPPPRPPSRRRVAQTVEMYHGAPSMPELPTVSFICAILVLVPIATHVRARNVATLSLMAWLFVLNMLRFINTLVWANNADIRWVVYCDIGQWFNFASVFRPG
jgi:hypothetical protein